MVSWGFEKSVVWQLGLEGGFCFKGGRGCLDLEGE